MAHIVDAAESSIGIDLNRHLHRSADARVMIGIIAHVGLAHIGLRQHRADRGIAAGAECLETLRFHDAGRQSVIGSRHEHEPLAAHQRPEFFSHIHFANSLSIPCRSATVAR